MCAVCGHGLHKTPFKQKDCELVRDTLARNGNNLTWASRELGISVSALKRKAIKLGLKEKGIALLRDRKHKCPVAVAANNGIEPS